MSERKSRIALVFRMHYSCSVANLMSSSKQIHTGVKKPINKNVPVSATVVSVISVSAEVTAATVVATAVATVIATVVAAIVTASAAIAAEVTITAIVSVPAVVTVVAVARAIAGHHGLRPAAAGAVRNLDTNLAAVDLHTSHLADGGSGLRRTVHGHEGEPARTSGGTVD
jgi:uncharacterized Tic20 family protein